MHNFCQINRYNADKKSCIFNSDKTKMRANDLTPTLERQTSKFRDDMDRSDTD